MMNHLKSMTQPEIGAALKELGQPAFRAKQVFSWLHKGVRSYDEMTNLPKALRERLAETYPLHTPKVVRRQESKKDGTIKFLWELSDGNCVETVLMRYRHGNSICISTQAGCKMGCAFCASFDKGKTRNLTPAEIYDQILSAQYDSGRKVSNIVLMGTGEPLDNYDNVIKFLHNVNHEKGLNIGYRHITISSCGLVPNIRALADEELPITLVFLIFSCNHFLQSF